MLMFLASVRLSIMMFLTGGGGISQVTSALSDVGTFVSEVFTMIIGNPILVVFLAISLLGAAIGIFRKLRGASR